MLEHLEMVLFLNFFLKMFVWTHEPPIGDFGGRGPSPSVLKQKAQNGVATYSHHRKITGDFTKGILAGLKRAWS